MTNVALVVLDTLRKDYFNQYFEWVPGLKFDRAYSTSNWTVPVHGTLFTGLYPSESGVHSKNTTLNFPDRVLAEELSESGYRTRAFSANTNVSAHFDFNRGFDRFASPGGMEHLNDPSIVDWREFNKQTPHQGIRKYISALRKAFFSNASTSKSLLSAVRLQLLSSGIKGDVEYGGTKEAIEWINKTSVEEDEFLFLNLMETHEPYCVPKEYQSISEPGLTKAVGDITYGSPNGSHVKQAYEDCARYLSDIYGELFDILYEDFDYIITLSDHGEMLGENEMWGHEYGVFPELVHVPLAISGPDLPDEVRSDPVSLIDVHKTVLELTIGGDRSRRGENLLLGENGGSYLTEYQGLTPWSEESLAEHGFQDKIKKYDSEKRGIVTDSEYHYETESGLVNQDGSEANQKIVDCLEDLIANLDKRKVETNNDVPEEIQDRLEDLGYA